MSDEYDGIEKPKVHLQEYQRQYQRARKKGAMYFMMKPSSANQLKGYFEEYLHTCQQNLLPTVEFNQFVVQYAIIGWLNARDKLKGK